MSNFPTSIYSPRTMVNRPGIIYDAAKTKRIYAEDFNLDRDEIVALETALGINMSNVVNPNGKSGGQTIKGGTESGENLTLMSTFHATKGKILLGNSAYDEVNNRLGINIQSPSNALHIVQPVSDANNGVLKLVGYSGVDYAGLTLWDGKSSPTSTARNWQIANNYQVGGNLDILRSTSSTGNPTTFVACFDSSGNMGLGSSSPTSKLDINSSVLRLRTSKTPSSASDTGNAGDICWDSGYIYVCVATNTWKRVAIATW